MRIKLMKPKMSARQDLNSCDHIVNVKSGKSQKGFRKKTRKQIGWRLIEEKAREGKIARNFLLLPRIPAARLPKETAGQRPDFRPHQSMPVDGNKSRSGETWSKDRRYRMKKKKAINQEAGFTTMTKVFWLEESKGWRPEGQSYLSATLKPNIWSTIKKKT